MSEKVSWAHRRFIFNMDRIAGLMKLVTSNEGEFKPTRFMTYEGVSADIFRLIVVFLHASVEDLVRSQLTGKRQFSFQSGSDIDKALKSAGFDPSPPPRANFTSVVSIIATSNEGSRPYFLTSSA